MLNKYSMVWDFKKAQAELRTLGITLRKTDGEYRVAFAGKGTESSAYYTNDIEDAVNTGRAMFNKREAKLDDATE